MYILFIHSVSVHIVFVFILLRCLRALAGYAYSSLCLLYVLPMYLLYYLLQPTKKKPKQNPHLILAKQVKWGSTLGLTAGYTLPTV